MQQRSLDNQRRGRVDWTKMGRSKNEEAIVHEINRICRINSEKNIRHDLDGVDDQFRMVDAWRPRSIPDTFSVWRSLAGSLRFPQISLAYRSRQFHRDGSERAHTWLLLLKDFCCLLMSPPLLFLLPLPTAVAAAAAAAAGCCCPCCCCPSCLCCCCPLLLLLLFF